MNITEFREKNPDYNDIEDAELTKLLHQKYYSDIPIEEFSKKFSGKVELPNWLQSMSDKQTEPGFERDVLPIAGDIAGSLMPSPLGKAKAVTKLGKLGLGAAKTLFKSGQAAAGSAAGEFGAQKLFGEETDPEKIKSQALWGAIGEGSSRAVAPLLKPVFNWASSLTATGTGIKEWARKNLIKKTADRATEFIKDVAPDTVKQAGMKIDIDDLGLAVTEAFDETKVIYDAYGKHVDAMAKNPDGGVILDDTQQLLYDMRDSWVEKVSETFDLKRDIKDVTKQGLPEWYAVTSAKNVDEANAFGQTKIISGIKETYGWADTSPQGLILLQSMRDEVIRPDDLKQLLVSFWKKGAKSDFANLTATQITNRETLKKTVLEDLARSSPEGAALKDLGDKNWGEISNFNKLQKIYNSALRDMPSGDKYVNPTLLSKNIYKNKKMIEKDMPGKWPKLKAEADFYTKVAHNWRPPQQGLLQGTMKMGPGALGAGVTAMTIGPQWIPAVESFGAFSAWMHLKPEARKAMGAVVRNAIVKPAVHTLPQ